MKRRVASSLSSSHTSIWSSWTYVNDTFDNDFRALEEAGTLRMDGPFQVIWKTKQKYVLKAVASSGTTTEFAEGYADGRDFMPANNAINDAALLDEFIFRNLTMLARIHDNNILHRGFTPANLLYKLRQTPDAQGNKLDLMWIDVASCRKMSRFMLKRSLSVDFEQLFRFFDFDDDTLLKYLRHYCAAAKSPLATPEQLLRNLKKNLAKREEKKRSRQ